MRNIDLLNFPVATGRNGRRWDGKLLQQLVAGVLTLYIQVLCVFPYLFKERYSFTHDIHI